MVFIIPVEWHQDTGNVEAWLMLCIFRGYIDAMIQYASQKDILDPYLLSLAPSVSFKYVTNVLYITNNTLTENFLSLAKNEGHSILFIGVSQNI